MPWLLTTPGHPAPRVQSFDRLADVAREMDDRRDDPRAYVRWVREDGGNDDGA